MEPVEEGKKTRVLIQKHEEEEEEEKEEKRKKEREKKKEKPIPSYLINQLR